MSEWRISSSTLNFIWEEAYPKILGKALASPEYAQSILIDEEALTNELKKLIPQRSPIKIPEHLKIRTRSERRRPDFILTPTHLLLPWPELPWEPSADPLDSDETPHDATKNYLYDAFILRGLRIPGLKLREVPRGEDLDAPKIEELNRNILESYTLSDILSEALDQVKIDRATLEQTLAQNQNALGIDIDLDNLDRAMLETLAELPTHGPQWQAIAPLVTVISTIVDKLFPPGGASPPDQEDESIDGDLRPHLRGFDYRNLLEQLPRIIAQAWRYDEYKEDYIKHPLRKVTDVGIPENMHLRVADTSHECIISTMNADRAGAPHGTKWVLILPLPPKPGVKDILEAFIRGESDNPLVTPCPS